ncbi:MAG: hypothetical protein GY850_46645 [bacterium]|nr:hypothetical protein [bacterium]
MSKKARARVLEAVKRLDYNPNSRSNRQYEN